MQMAILAGGLATRLGSLAKGKPKSLIQIQGKPFLEYQLDFLKKSETRNIVLCVGYLGEQIERHFGDGSKFGVDIKYSYEREKLLGTAGALKKAEGLLEEEFFVMYGDSYLFLDFAAAMDYFNDFNNLGLMTVYKNYNRYDTSNVVLENNKVKQYSKKKKSKDMIYVDYGASILRKKVLELVPQNQIYSLEELFSELIKQKEFLTYEVHKRFYHIGSPEGLEEFQQYASEGGVTL